MLIRSENRLSMLRFTKQARHVRNERPLLPFGAVNEREGLSEFDFNEDLAIRIEKKIRNAEVQRIYRRTYKGNHSPPPPQFWMGINKINELALSLSYSKGG